MRSTWKTNQPFAFLFKLIVAVTIILVLPITLGYFYINSQFTAPSASEEKKLFVISQNESVASF
jgi:hypothetical protein